MWSTGNHIFVNTPLSFLSKNIYYFVALADVKHLNYVYIFVYEIVCFFNLIKSSVNPYKLVTHTPEQKKKVYIL